MSEASSRRGRLSTLLLLLLCCGLSGAIYAGATEPVTPASLAAPVALPSPRPLGTGPGFSMPPLSAYAEVVARPLFSATRRPAAQAALDKKPADFALVGTVISSRERHALLSHGVPAEVERVVEGQSIDGWTVTSIEPGRVMLAQGGRQAEVDSSAKPPPSAFKPQAPPRYAPRTAQITSDPD